MTPTVKTVHNGPIRARGKSATRIIAVALDLFSRRGFDAVSTTDIADVAGVSQPTVLYHFASKQTLWEAAMVHLSEQVRAALPAAPNRQSGLALLRVMGDQLLSVSAAVPALGRVIMLEGQAGGARLNWLVEHVLGAYYDAFTAAIDTAISAGQIKPYPAPQILMLLHGGAVTWFNMAPLVETSFAVSPDDAAEAAQFRALYLDVMFAGLISAPVPADMP